MRILVETTGSFQLLYPERDELVRAEGLTVIEKSQWAAMKAGIGQLLNRGEVNDDATDEAWRDTLNESDGDEDLALAAFLAEYPVTAESARKAQPSAPAARSSTVQREHNKTEPSGSFAPKPGRAK